MAATSLVLGFPVSKTRLEIPEVLNYAHVELLMEKELARLRKEERKFSSTHIFAILRSE